MMKSLLKQLYKRHDSLAISQQLEYVDELANKYQFEYDPLKRVYLHYNCVMKGIGIIERLILNTGALILNMVLPFLYCLNSMRSCQKKNRKAVYIDNYSKLGARYDTSDRFPQNEVNNTYGGVVSYDVVNYPDIFGGELNIYCLGKWIKLVLRYPYLPYMNLSCLLRLGLVYRIIRRFNPSAIIASRTEEACSSSFITWICNSMGISHELIMHGELLISMVRGFTYFSRIYIWDDYYRKIFERVYAYADEYVVFRPKLLTYVPLKCPVSQVFMTYYLQGIGGEGYYDEASGGNYTENIIEILDILNRFASSGKIVRIRPHPRWTNLEKLKKRCEGTQIIIEDTNSISAEESLNTTNYVVGYCSTILLQALYMKKTVVIDDYTNSLGYKELVDGEYILLHKKHLLLSELLSK